MRQLSSTGIDKYLGGPDTILCDAALGVVRLENDQSHEDEPHSKSSRECDQEVGQKEGTEPEREKTFKGSEAKTKKVEEDLSLEEILENINFSSIEVLSHGSGWVGTRYVLHTYNYGSSWYCETMEELKQWIIKELGWQLRSSGVLK